MADTKIVLIIASAGQGKTYKANKLIAGKKCCVFDVAGQYDDLPWDVKEPRSRFFNADPKKFIEVCNEKHDGTICVFEEATSFFEGKTGKEMKNLITMRRHPIDKGGRNIVLIFHTVNTVPPFLLDNANTIILGKTGESATRIKSKKEELHKIALWLKTQPDRTFYNFKNV